MSEKILRKLIVVAEYLHKLCQSEFASGKQMIIKTLIYPSSSNLIWFERENADTVLAAFVSMTKSIIMSSNIRQLRS